MHQSAKRVDGGGKGKLAVLMPGLGAVATTFVAGVELVKRKQAAPVGALSQMGALACRKEEGRAYRIRDVVPLATLEDLVFGAWDIVREDGAAVAERSQVLSPEHLEAARPALEAL